MLNGDVAALDAVAFCAGSVDVLGSDFNAYRAVGIRGYLYRNVAHPAENLCGVFAAALAELDAAMLSSHPDTAHYHKRAVAELMNILAALKAFHMVSKDVAVQRLRDANSVEDHPPNVVITIPMLIGKLLTLDVNHAREEDILRNDFVASLDLHLDSWLCLECLKTKVVAARSWLVWYRAKSQGLVTGQPLQPDCM